MYYINHLLIVIATLGGNNRVHAISRRLLFTHRVKKKLHSNNGVAGGGLDPIETSEPFVFPLLDYICRYPVFDATERVIPLKFAIYLSVFELRYSVESDQGGRVVDVAQHLFDPIVFADIVRWTVIDHRKMRRFPCRRVLMMLMLL